MTPALTTSARQLLALVRSSLWQAPVDEQPFFFDSVDWQQIGKLAMQQTVGVMAFQATFELPENLLPPKEWIQKALAFIEANRQTHILVDKSVAEAVTRLRAEGLDPVLLKGQAYARVYPSQEMRQCGDIDLYVGEVGYHRTYESVKAIGWDSEERFVPKAKHYGCSLHGVRIELHRIAAQLSTGSADRKFQEWSTAQIASYNRTLTIANQEIPVPTATFDIVFVFLHLYHHFINGGIGLRHICDWTMLLHAHTKEINPEELKLLLKEFGLLRAWQSFAPIPVCYLGLPESECPFYSSKYERRSEKILETILKEGNFGWAKHTGFSRPEGYLAKKLYVLHQVCTNHVNKVRFDPFAVTRSFGRIMLVGAAGVLKDMMKGTKRTEKDRKDKS